MKKLTKSKVFQELCKFKKKWGLYISFDWELDENNMEELCKAAPYLNVDEDIQLLSDGIGFILCDSEKEMLNLFEQTVGDEGPTKLNRYFGPAKIFAITCSPKGELLDVNT